MMMLVGFEMNLEKVRGRFGMTKEEEEEEKKEKKKKKRNGVDGGVGDLFERKVGREKM
jgi:hypothetical protein